MTSARVTPASGTPRRAAAGAPLDPLDRLRVLRIVSRETASRFPVRQVEPTFN